MEQYIKNPIFKIKLIQLECKFLIFILQKADFCNSSNKALAMIYQWHKNELINKLHIANNKQLITGAKSITIKVNEVEKHLVSILYTKVQSEQIEPIIFVTMEKFIKGLIKFDANAA